MAPILRRELGFTSATSVENLLSVATVPRPGAVGYTPATDNHKMKKRKSGLKYKTRKAKKNPRDEEVSGLFVNLYNPRRNKKKTL